MRATNPIRSEGSYNWSTDLALLCSADHHRIHQPGYKTALTNDHPLIVWNPHGTLVNDAALRDPAINRKNGGPTTPTKPAHHDLSLDHDLDPACRLHGTGEPITNWALDTFVSAWLQHT